MGENVSYCPYVHRVYIPNSTEGKKMRWQVLFIKQMGTSTTAVQFVQRHVGGSTLSNTKRQRDF